jgi:hypothetical protein
MFLDVGNGVSINSEFIESIETVDSMNCSIITSSKAYLVSMPKELVMSMICKEDGEERKMSSVEKLLTQIYSTQQTLRV